MKSSSLVLDISTGMDLHYDFEEVSRGAVGTAWHPPAGSLGTPLSRGGNPVSSKRFGVEPASCCLCARVSFC